FIDDLDRCNPERALHLLEGIKLILNQTGMIFVMGIDRNVIEKYLEHVYEEKYGIKGEGRGGRYLDKIVQLPLTIPKHRANLKKHFSALCKQYQKSTVSNGKIIDVLERVRPALLEGCGGNPRALVRLLNSYFIDCELWDDN